MLGPNCLGVLDSARRLGSASNPLPPGAIGLISQSGNLAAGAGPAAAPSGPRLLPVRLARATRPTSRSPTCVADCAATARPSVIAVYVEDFRDGRALRDAAAEAMRTGKPVMLLAAGASAAGARAGRLAHRGDASATGRSSMRRAAAAGAIRVSTPRRDGRGGEGAAARSLAPRARGSRSLTDGGGHGSDRRRPGEPAGLERARASARRSRGRSAGSCRAAAGSREPDRPGGRRRAGLHSYAWVIEELLRLRRGRLDPAHRLLRRLRASTRDEIANAEMRERRGDRREAAHGAANRSSRRRCSRPSAAAVRCAKPACRCSRRSRTPIAPSARWSSRRCRAAPARSCRCRRPRRRQRRWLLGRAGGARRRPAIRFGHRGSGLSRDGGCSPRRARSATRWCSRRSACSTSRTPVAWRWARRRGRARRAYDAMAARLAPRVHGRARWPPLVRRRRAAGRRRRDPRFGPVVAGRPRRRLHRGARRHRGGAGAGRPRPQAEALLRSLRGAPLLGARGRPPLDLAAAAARCRRSPAWPPPTPRSPSSRSTRCSSRAPGVIGLDARVALRCHATPTDRRSSSGLHLHPEQPSSASAPTL